jgi:hypothetical protein
VSGRFVAELWIGNGQIYKLSAMQKLGIACLLLINKGNMQIAYRIAQ